MKRDKSGRFEKINYLWAPDKFVIMKKPKFYKAAFVISSSPNHLWKKILSHVLVAKEPTKQHAIKTLKKLVDKRVLQNLNALRVGKNQIGFTSTDIEKEGVRIWLEYDNYDPHKKNYVVYDFGKQKLITRIEKK